MKVLESFEFKGRGPAGQSVWLERLDGKPRQFEQGVDYTNPNSFRQDAYRAAKKLGKTIRTQLVEGGKFVVIQAD